MEINIGHEMLVFWSSFLCGQAICVFFDFFRSLRKIFCHTKRLVAIEDIIFCAVSFKIFFDICYITNSGRLRLFLFVAAILSALLYYCILTKHVCNAWEFILRIFVRIVSPFAKLFCFLKAKLLEIFKKIASFFTKMFKKLSFHEKFCNIKRFFFKKFFTTRKK